MVFTFLGISALGWLFIVLTVAFLAKAMGFAKRIPIVGDFVENAPVEPSTSFLLGIIFLGLFAWNMGFLDDLAGGTPTAAAVAEAELAACAVGQQNYRDSVTMTVKQFDQQSRSESELPVAYAVYDQDGKIVDIDDTYSATFSANVGDVIEVYQGNATAYGTTPEPLCVTGGDTINLDVDALATETTMEIVVYDDTSTNELTAGDNSTQEDYEIDMSDEDSEFIFVKLTNDGSRSAYDLGAVAIIEYNSSVINDVTLLSDDEDGSWSKDIVPKYLETTVNLQEWAGTNLTVDEWDEVYVRSEVARLEKGDSILVKFEIETDLTAPVEDDTDSQASGAFVAIQFLDKAWAEDSEGDMQYDYYQLTDDESNVGLAESISSPLGKELGVIVELT